MRIYVDRENRLISHAVIPRSGGDEAIHSILDIMHARAPYTTIARATHIHPTVLELIATQCWKILLCCDVRAIHKDKSIWKMRLSELS